MAVEEGFQKFFDVFYKARWVIIIVWAAFVGVGAYYATKFFGRTTLIVRPPPGTDSERSENLYNALYGPRANEGELIAFLAAKDPVHGPDVRTGDWANITSQFIFDVARQYDNGTYVSQMAGRYYWPEEELKEIGPIYDAIKKVFFGPQNRSTMLLFATKEMGTLKAFDFLKHMRKRIAEGVDTRNGTFVVYVAGMDSIVVDVADKAIDDLKRMDVFTLPIAIIILAYVVRSLTVMIVPILSLASCVAASFGIMYWVSYLIHVPSFTAGIMMSIILAMSIDYSLFIFTRFSEEIHRGRNIRDSVMYSLRYSGQTILTSGFILSLCVLSIIAYPVEMMRVVGIGTAISLWLTVLGAIVFTPAMLLVGGKFFSIPGLIPCIKSCREIHAPTKKEAHEEEIKSWWFRFTDYSTNFPRYLIVIGVIVVLLVPFICGMTKWYVVTGISHLVPRGCETDDAMKRIKKEWPIGMLTPFQVIVVPKKYLDPEESSSLLSSSLMSSSSSSGSLPVEGPIFTPEFFDVSHQLIHTLLNTTAFDKNNLLSLTNFGGDDVQFDEAEYLYLTSNIVYQFLYKYLTNPAGTAARITLSTTFDPNQDCTNVTHLVRPILENFTANTNFSFFLTSQLTAIADSAERGLDFYPYILGIDIGIIAVFICIIFRSLVLPLRMVITIGLTVLWTYGTIAYVFCTNWFYWIHPIKEQPGINWIVPLMAIFIVIGLALDYDIFLFTRVREFRRHGWSDRASIVKGVARTGRVITFAGIIMAIAFCGLILSSVLLLDQVAFLLTISVLLDTFVIRTSLNPAIMYMCGKSNFECWMRPAIYEDPKQFYPEAEKTEGDDDDDDTVSPERERLLEGDRNYSIQDS